MSGRIDRKTYRSAIGMLTIAGGLEMLLSSILIGLSPLLCWSFKGLFMLVSLWAGFALHVKRLRDMGRSPALLILPIGLIALAALTMGSMIYAALLAHSGAGVIAGLFGGGLVLIGASVVSSGMLLWMTFAGTSANAVGLLSFNDSDHHDGPSETRRGLGLEAALNQALRGQESKPAPALSTLVRPSGLPRRPGVAVGGFGRR
ncbi:MAG: DUF805 domain-containing protein [Rhodoblastus sp.]|nr:MAG: DUF805 domain-containing protein [Rhodoblastus sp.]